MMDDDQMPDGKDIARSTLKTRLSEIPDRFTTKVKAGFVRLARFDSIQRRALVSNVFELLSNRANPSAKDIEQLSSLSSEEGGDVLLSVTMVFGALIDLELSADEFLAEAAALFGPEEAAAVRDVAEAVVLQRPELTRAMDTAALASSVLPSLVRFDLEIDLRMRFEDGGLTQAVPVAVVYIGSDGEGQDTWIQLTQTDVEMLLQRLTKAAEEMRLAEAFAERASAGGNSK